MRAAVTRVRRVALAVSAAAVAFVMLPASPAAAADNATANWSNNDLTGFCRDVSGGYVIEVQQFLYAAGRYAGPIDGQWGSNSDAALRGYQSSRGLSVDGCAGPATHADMQALTFLYQHRSCPSGVTLTEYRYANAHLASFDRSAGTGLWYTDVGASPSGGSVQRFTLYRFSANFTTGTC